jgi:hypothetical protein
MPASMVLAVFISVIIGGTAGTCTPARVEVALRLVVAPVAVLVIVEVEVVELSALAEEKIKVPITKVSIKIDNFFIFIII